MLHTTAAARDVDRRIALAVIRDAAQYHVPGSSTITFTDATGKQATRMLSGDEYKLGPLTPRGTPIEFDYRNRTPADKLSVWRDALRAHNNTVYNRKGGASQYGDMSVAGNAPDRGCAPGCAPAASRWWDGLGPGAKAGVGIGGFVAFVLVGGGITLGVGGGAYGWFDATPGETPSGSTVTVTLPPHDGPTQSSDRYLVTLTKAGTGETRSQSAMGDATTLVFENVADGTYTVTVQYNMEPVLTGEVTVMASPITANPTAPLPPTAVKITAIASSTSTRPGVTVAWIAPNSTVTGYTVTVSTIDKNGNTDKLPTVEAGTATSVVVPIDTAGSYVASVTASNGRATSTAAESQKTAPAVVDPTIPAAGAPRNVRFVAYRSGATGKPGFVVRWDPPATGGWVKDYSVTVGSQTVTVSALMVPFPDQADGSYSASVTAQTIGSTTSGTPATATAKATFTLAAASILPDSVDWGMFFSADEIAAFETKGNGLDALDDNTFWANVTKAVEDSAGDYGGLASYQEQLGLARLLAAWLRLPVDPMPNVVDGYADALCKLASFPTSAMGPANLAKLSSELWTKAPTLTNPITRTAIQRRYQVLAIVRAISRYLGPGDGRRLYDFSTLPFETVPLTSSNAGVTAQRYRFTCNGHVSGVWWYRVPGDTGIHTVNAWKGTSSVAVATGDPGGVGWVYLGFPTAIAVQIGDELVFGVYHPQGIHARRLNAFANGALSVTCLTSPQHTTAKPNGLYGYIAPGVFPTLFYEQAEYYITPEFVAS